MRNYRILTVLALMGALAAAPGNASEQAEIGSGSDFNNDGVITPGVETVDTEDTPSNVTANTQTLRQTTSTNLANISRGISRLAPAGGGGGGIGGGAPGAGGVPGPQTGVLRDSTGMSAGGGEGKIGVWINGSWSDVENDLASTALDGDVYSVFGGADYQVMDRFFAGVSLGFEDSDIDTLFNQGNIEADGFTVAPYLLYVINRWFTFDVSGGYSWLDYDQSRFFDENPLDATPGRRLNGEFDSDRWFAAANLTGYYSIRNWNLSGTVGYLYTVEDQDDLVEDDPRGGTIVTEGQKIRLGQLNVGTTIGYSLGNIEPFVTATYQNDFVRNNVAVGPGDLVPANDDDGFILGGGVRFNLGDRISGSIEATTLEGREDESATTVNGTIRVRF